MPTTVAGESYGAIDIVANAFTPEALDAGWMSTDMNFREKVRVKPEYRDGVTAAQYIEMMDRAGIERTLLCAQRSGDIRIQGLQRTDPGTVFSVLPFRIDDEYNDDKGAVALRALFATGLFKAVRLEVQGSAEGATFTRAQLDQLMDLAEKGVGALVEAQRAATA